MDEKPALQRFCLVLCCARTGGTLLTSLLDAHPHIVMANEARAPSLIQAGLGREELFERLREHAFEHARAGKEWTGFRYAVPGQHQGTFRRLEVLGDKSGVLPALCLHVQHELLEQVRATVGVRLQVIHQVRNPYDVISTMARRSGASLRNRAGVFFSVCVAIQSVRERLPAADFISVRHEDLLAAPEEHLAELCRFLGQDATADYLEACARVVERRPHQSRHEQPWTAELIDEVNERMRGHDFLAGYAFSARQETDVLAGWHTRHPCHPTFVLEDGWPRAISNEKTG